MQEEISICRLKNNISIAYKDTGTHHKHTILFIHGLANYHGVWQWNTSILSTKYRCIAIDLPGNGFSDRNALKYSMDFYSSCVIDFIKEMKLQTVTLAGHSMGGMIAMKSALNTSVKIEKLILFAPAGFEYYSPHEAVLFQSAITLGNFLNLDETQINQSIRTSFYQQNHITEKIIKELCDIIQHNDRAKYRTMLEQSIQSMLDDNIFEEMKNITQPTLIFFGEEDMLIPNRFLHPVSTKEIAYTGSMRIQNSSVILYQKTGHFVHIERANEANKEIINFLK